MTALELLARNVSAALREAQNALNAAGNVDVDDIAEERDRLDVVVGELEEVSSSLRDRQKRT